MQVDFPVHFDFMRDMSPERVRLACRAAVGAGVENLGATYPNPPVGCAIVDRAGEILAVGGHRRAGGPHAEIEALNNLDRAGRTADAFAMFVTLEPCAHYGRTPPCARAILERSPVKHVVIGMGDGTDLAKGGADYLRSDNVNVVWADAHDLTREFARDSAALHAPFLSAQLRDKPWVVVKQALDEKGSMIPPEGRKTFTSQEALTAAHLLRRASDTLVTTTATVAADAPLCDVRHVTDFAHVTRNLVIVGNHAHLCRDWAAARREAGFSLHFAPHLDALEDCLRGIRAQTVLVEAGPRFLGALKERAIWDEWFTIRKNPSGLERCGLELSDDAVSFLEDDLDRPSASLVQLLARFSPDWRLNLTSIY